MIYERLAAVRAYDRVIPGAPVEQLHALRIEFKKIRYTVEYFKEVLGPEAAAIIEEFKVIQDHLGDLNDAQVASNLIQDYLDAHQETEKEPGTAEQAKFEGLETYKNYRENELAQLIASFPEVWQQFNRPEFRQSLALAISVL